MRSCRRWGSSTITSTTATCAPTSSARARLKRPALRPHSSRSAIVGSTRAARRAGSQVASSRCATVSGSGHRREQPRIDADAVKRRPPGRAPRPAPSDQADDQAAAADPRRLLQQHPDDVGGARAEREPHADLARPAARRNTRSTRRCRDTPAAARRRRRPPSGRRRIPAPTSCAGAARVIGISRKTGNVGPIRRRRRAPARSAPRALPAREPASPSSAPRPCAYGM